jgi:hypothetical protein
MGTGERGAEGRVMSARRVMSVLSQQPTRPGQELEESDQPYG